MGTSFFENAVNVGLLHRGCVINAALTQVTHVDNAMFATQGHVATLPKKVALQHCHHVVSRALSTRGNPQWVALTNFYMNFYDKGLQLFHVTW